MEKKKIYISGPISGRDERESRADFAMSAHWLSLKGWLTYNPMENGLEWDAPWSAHIRRDMEALLECDAIYMKQCWEQSRGAMLELQVAVALGMDVIYE